MRAGKSLVELATEVTRQMNTKRDLVARSNALEMDSSGMPIGSSSMLGVNGGERFAAAELTHNQIGEYLGIPMPFYRRIRQDHPDLLDVNVNRLLQARPDTERRMLRTIDGQARAFLSDRYRRLDNYDLLDAILPDLASRSDLQFVSCEVTETKMYLKIVSDKLTRDVAVGDTVRVGLQITNSEVGLGGVVVQPFSERLVCLNGAVHPNFGMRKNHVGRGVQITEDIQELFADETLQADDKAFYLKVRDVTRATLSETVLEKVVAQMREANGIRIEGDPTAAVEELSNRYRLNQAEKGGVLRHLIEGHSLSLWGMTNAITAVANDVEDYDRSSDLQALGGQLLALPREDLRPILQAA